MFFFNHAAPTEIYTLSLHDALPICAMDLPARSLFVQMPIEELILSAADKQRAVQEDRKSTRLNSSHLGISYAVFCLKKKKSNCPMSKSVFVVTRHIVNALVYI